MNNHAICQASDECMAPFWGFHPKLLLLSGSPMVGLAPCQVHSLTFLMPSSFKIQNVQKYGRGIHHIISNQG